MPLAYSFNDPGLGPNWNGNGISFSYTPGEIEPPEYLTPRGPNPLPGYEPFYSNGGLPTLTFYTVNGSITPFDMSFGAFYNYGAETLTLTSSGDSFQAGNETPDCGCGGNWSGSNEIGGTWSNVTNEEQPLMLVSAPELRSASSLAPLTLLVGAVMILRTRNRSLA